MKHGKQLLAGLLAAVLTLAVTACGTTEPETSDVSAVSADESADAARSAEMYALYTAAMDKVKDRAGTNVTVSGSYTVAANGRASVTNVELDFRSMEKGQSNTSDKAAGKRIDTVYTDHLIASLSGSGSETSYDLYYKDGVAYRTENGKKSKQTVARSTALKDIALIQIIPLSEAAFESPIVAHVDDSTMVSLPLNGDMLSDELLSETGAPAYILGRLDDTAEYTFRNVTVKLTFRKDGYLTGYDLYYVMTADDAAQTSLTVSLATVFRDPDKKVSFKLPKLSDYEKSAAESGLNQKAYDAMPVVVDTLFDADGKRVDMFDKLYASLCKTYGKAVVDTVVSWFESQP